LKTRPDWRKIVKKPEYHESAGLLQGLEENYRSLEAHGAQAQGIHRAYQRQSVS
jgi:hypothetical protein